MNQLISRLGGIEKTAFVMPPEQPARWEAIYVSVTVSQIGKEFPNGGMNEVGLVWSKRLFGRPYILVRIAALWYQNYNGFNIC
jgi:hypothetical protein